MYKFTSENLMTILRCALWGELYCGSAENENALMIELEKQGVLPLIQSVLTTVNLSDEQRESWDDRILAHIYCNQRIMDVEKAMTDLFRHNNIPCVILKGTSYAQYYPNPILRTLGDIDILVKKEDFEPASDLLLREGYSSETTPQKSPNARHIEYFKDDTEVELHQYFNDADKNSEYFSTAKARPSNSQIPYFPSVENGISMLLHFKFHLGRTGLRHYLDWIMFVRNICDDAFWNAEFKTAVDRFGVTDLAKALTKAGKTYFPLQHITWCDDADPARSSSLLDEFVKAGNFNTNLSKKKALTITNSGKSIFYWVKFISKRGVDNWPPAQKHKVLAPAAFIRQVYKYAKWYIRDNGMSFKDLKKDTKELRSIKEEFTSHT